MFPTHISSTSRALYRVFIAPNLRASTSIPLVYIPSLAQLQYNIPSTQKFTPRTAIRAKSYREVKRQGIADYFVIDKAIPARTINFVDQDGKFWAGVDLDEALESINRKTYHIVQVDAGKVDEAGRPDPRNLPTCRAITKIDLREQLAKKLDVQRRQEKGQGAGASSKELELNWAIAGGDLKHRLEKLKGFLVDGRKVLITLGPKKRGRKATEEEAQGVLKALKNAFDECRGASETKREGTVGGVMTITVEGRKLPPKQA